MTFNTIQPYQYAALRLPSDQVRVEQLTPNTLINLGKYGSFNTNFIIGRPYHLTFEILDRAETQEGRPLRVVPAAELHVTALIEEADTEDGTTPAADLDDVNVQPSMKSNVNIIDDPTTQKLTMAEIEALKQDEMGSSRELIAKIMESHTALDQKTAFSLAKYTLRKHKKYMKRFTVLPLDVVSLVDFFMAEKDFSRVMEMRNEAVGLVGCWANVHADGYSPVLNLEPSSRYLVVDDTGGLVVAALAERMGVLHLKDIKPVSSARTDEDEETTEASTAKPKRSRHGDGSMSAISNSITIIHANQQPNLALLRYFNFDTNHPNPSHPLNQHLKTLSWLQLIEPESDPSYQEPDLVSPKELTTFKSGRRSNYYRKRRRWERIRNVVDETRAGEFNGLIVASFTNPVSILHRLVPLLAGGSQIVVYSPHIEPLVELADCYSTARRTAFINKPENERIVPSEDFPVEPTLLLVPMVQTARIRKWQVLPGRSHPLMMGKGGAEGYIFVATKVIPAEGKVTARGRPPRSKPKQLADDESVQSESNKKQKLADSQDDSATATPVTLEVDQ